MSTVPQPSDTSDAWKRLETCAVTIIAAVLGLLVASGKISSDSKDSIVQAANIIGGALIVAWPAAAHLKGRHAN